jgi:predicted RNase H-like HicB family nuclease
MKEDTIMKLNQNECTVEAATGGGFFAYYKDNLLCSAYGETPDEAFENLERVIDDFISDMYMVEEYV